MSGAMEYSEIINELEPIFIRVADALDWVEEILEKHELEDSDKSHLKVLHHYLYEEVKKGGLMVFEKVNSMR